jgi:alpha-amylase/alpha-mannosidase (GH57 family)
MSKYICIHGHFYQPPRENPWLEYVEQQDSALPYHDWNDRITAECYEPNTASRILSGHDRISNIVNNYSRISFNFGPTLLSWLERHRPDVYGSILEADRISIDRFSGHGSALAQVYNHMIMPLANRRDRETQVAWGIADFEKRFNRFPEGMWLPETAVDTETLEVLAEAGIRFTILAPHQAQRVRKLGRGGRWQDVRGGRVNPTMPYRCRLPSGNEIALFFYDGPISQEIAFGGLLNNGEVFAKRLLSGLSDTDETQLMHIATDGETYGHHHRHGEMALTYCLHHIEHSEDAEITIYGKFLADHPPTHEAEIIENSSWSCIHGIGRWRENCGCHSGMHPGWTQEWREPLRETLDTLRDAVIPFFEKEMGVYFEDPWSARNDYIRVILDRKPEVIDEFLNGFGLNGLSVPDKRRILKLLEMQRNAMLMYTSCGWFFDELSGIETTQIMLYAARVMQIAETLELSGLECAFLERLEKSPSNVFKNGREVYEKYVQPAKVDLLRVGAHYAVSSLFERYPDTASIYCYIAEREEHRREEAGKLKLAIGKARIVSELTYAEQRVSYAVIHLGDHNIYGGVKAYEGNGEFDRLNSEIDTAFQKADIPEIIRLMEKYFGTHNYSMWHLFKDDQRKILEKSQLLKQPLESVESFFRQVYEQNYTTMNFVRSLHIPLPKPLSLAILYTINNDLKKVFLEEDIDIQKLELLVREIGKWKIEVDQSILDFSVTEWVNRKMKALHDEPFHRPLLEEIETVMGLLRTIHVGWDLWQAQNLYYKIGKEVCPDLLEKHGTDEAETEQWRSLFQKLGEHLRVLLEC